MIINWEWLSFSKYLLPSPNISMLMWGLVLWLSLASGMWVNVRWIENWNDLAQLGLVSLLLPLSWEECFSDLQNKKGHMEQANLLIHRSIGTITNSYCCMKVQGFLYLLVTQQKLTDAKGYWQFQGERRKCEVVLSGCNRKNWMEEVTG